MGAPRPFDQQVTFLSVADLDRSTTFYRDTLGLALVLDQADCRIFGITATAFVAVCRRPDGVEPTGIIVTLVTDDVDEWHDHLVASSVPCERSPNLNERYNVYQAFYRDPDGYLIEIQRFKDPTWPRP